MEQIFAGQYFNIVNGTPTGLINVELTDTDLIRGNGTGESVDTAFFPLFDGFTTGGVFEDGEVTTTVTFTDGTSVSGVLGLYDRYFFKTFETYDTFLLDQDALAAVGKTMDDVAFVSIDGYVDHDLTWEDLGFTPTGVVVPDPEPEPEPEFTVITGTARSDVLTGTSANEILIGGGDDDRLTGGAGEDVFVFGADDRDMDRDRDVITDFNVNEDLIVLEDGASIRFVEQRGSNFIIQLEGDRDTIVVQNADISVVANIVYTDDLFVA